VADFPAIEPTGRAYDFGTYAMSATGSLSGSSVRFNHSSTMIGARLTLTFADMPDAELETLRAHFRGQNGGFVSFLLPAIIWQGHTDPEFLAPATDRWIYDGEIDEGEARPGGFYDIVTVHLRHVGAELA
jgi:hypothetical protein